MASSLPPSRGPLLYLAAAERAGDVAGVLAAHGITVDTVVVYRAVANPDVARDLRAALAEVDAVAVIIEEPSPAELAPVLMMAYGLTKQEQALTALVCRGHSTSEIADRLHISAHTVQDHLKSIFDKTGVSSRRELVVTILRSLG